MKHGESARTQNKSSLQLSDSEEDSESARKPLSFARRMFEDYSNNCAMDGMKYIGERDRHWVERAFWIIALIVSVVTCSLMIYDAYEKWQISPVIVSFAEKSTPVWQIPFPAVTICPETKVLKEHLDFTKAYRMSTNDEQENLTIDELKTLEAVAQVCDSHLFDKIKINSGLTPEEIIPRLQATSISLAGCTILCKWRNSMADCGAYFKEVLTEEGFCYTFNALDSSEIFKIDQLSEDFQYLNHNKTSDFWSLEKGYSTRDEKTYPRRVMGSGARAGLNVVLKLNQADLDYLCRGPVQGFKILFHTPGEIPRVSKEYFRLPLRQEVLVTVKPNMITTSDDLIDYMPDRRQCYFSDERFLRFFKVYTQNNCELECLANYTLNQCGCVKFSMPRDAKTRICSQSEVSCYNAAEDSLTVNELSHSLDMVSGQKELGTTLCNCLPSCTSIHYDAEMSQATYEFEEVLKAFEVNMSKFSGEIFARLTIYFKETQFITSKRSELYGLTDFVANCGGLMGLFIGVSIFSLVEIFYYITLRPACILRRKKKNATRASRSYDDNLLKSRIAPSPDN